MLTSFTNTFPVVENTRSTSLTLPLSSPEMTWASREDRTMEKMRGSAD